METTHDAMQVCRNGHVITDLLHTYPERGLSHCERCGAETLDCCPTCGWELPGASLVPGLVPVGQARPPQFCAACGAAFPWANRPEPVSEPTLALETLLRRLPLAVRQLRTRHADRPPFRVNDVFDVEDLLRAVLPLFCEEVRPETRTPAYSESTRTDFLVWTERGGGPTAVIAKSVTADLGERQLAAQLQEDVHYYERRGQVTLVVALLYDPEGRLREPRQLEAMWSKPHVGLRLSCLIAS